MSFFMDPQATRIYRSLSGLVDPLYRGTSKGYRCRTLGVKSKRAEVVQ